MAQAQGGDGGGGDLGLLRLGAGGVGGQCGDLCEIVCVCVCKRAFASKIEGSSEVLATPQALFGVW